MVAVGVVSLYIVLAVYSISGRGRSSIQPTEVALIQTEEVRMENEPTTKAKVVHFLKGLNQHTWTKNCQRSLEQLCNFPIFPNAPDSRSIVKNVYITSSVKDVDGIRLLGFLRPNVTGEYLFTVASNGVVEVWLSKSISWKDGAKVAHYPTKPQESSKLGVKLAAHSTYYLTIIRRRRS